MLYTTGRLTSEMVIKCALMGIPALASRSGFTAWGVEIARQVGLTLIGRMRGRRFLCLVGRRAAGLGRRPRGGARGAGAAPAPQERATTERRDRRGDPRGRARRRAWAAATSACCRSAAGRSSPTSSSGLRPQVDALALNANGDPARFAAFGLTVLRGRRRRASPGRWPACSPAWTGRRARGAEAIVTAAADTPFFPADLVTGLARRRCGRGDAARHGDDARRGRRARPAPDLRPLAGRAARGLGRRWRRACARSSPGPSRTAAPARSSATAARPFFNVNTPAELAGGRGDGSRRGLHEGLRRDRMEELGQDHARRTAGRRDHRARAHGLDAQARPPRIRRGSRPARTATAIGPPALGRCWSPRGSAGR